MKTCIYFCFKSSWHTGDWGWVAFGGVSSERESVITEKLQRLKTLEWSFRTERVYESLQRIWNIEFRSRALKREILSIAMPTCALNLFLYELIHPNMRFDPNRCAPRPDYHVWWPLIVRAIGTAKKRPGDEFRKEETITNCNSRPDNRRSAFGGRNYD